MKIKINDDIYKCAFSYEEKGILVKSLKLYIDHSPRKTKEKPSYYEKQQAMEMVETIIAAENKYYEKVVKDECKKIKAERSKNATT